MDVAIVVIAFNQPRWTEALFATAVSAKHELIYELHLHSIDPPTVAVCEQLAARSDVHYHPHGFNRGLSRTWNDGILAGYRAGADVVIVANDDISFSPGDLDRLVAKASGHRDSYIVSCAGYNERAQRPFPSHGYSCFAINPVALHSIGFFDENFFPIYCEDQDYARRAQLSGLSEENCNDTMIRHGGSSAIFGSPSLRQQNALTQARNLAYYRRKWGELAGHETFTTPFGDPSISLRIAPEARAHPYGVGYDRTDRDLIS